MLSTTFTFMLFKTPPPVGGKDIIIQHLYPLFSSVGTIQRENNSSVLNNKTNRE